MTTKEFTCKLLVASRAIVLPFGCPISTARRFRTAGPTSCPGVLLMPRGSGYTHERMTDPEERAQTEGAERRFRPDSAVETLGSRRLQAVDGSGTPVPWSAS
jgi:hypothetical protein